MRGTAFRRRTSRAPRPCRTSRAPRPCRTEQGQISLLILGFAVIALMLVLAAVDVTAAQLGRVRLMDAADSAALDAADELAQGAAYGSGVGDTVPITDTTVQQAAAAYLAGQPRPGGISAWSIAAGTGSPDAGTAVVRVAGTIELPVSSMLREVFGGSISITVESRARAVVQ
ncbi:MAG TPA: pilus assembly protein TadG-related protein [Dermatophilaceae bacterium]|nr:pilus assembly protein TadG-related protein [Dermatophilaceae bacterium]